MTENKNANQFPKVFYAKHMQSGLCGYDKETVLIDTDAIKLMMPTAVGMPIYVQHDYNTEEERLKNLEKDAVGFITESFYNELDGWFWFKCLATKDECHQAIQKGWSVSNAYIPTEFSGGGTKNNCAFSREIKNGKFTHLAIVPNPRYEDACVMSPDEFRTYQDLKKRQLEELQNSKGAKTMFKLFKTTKEEVQTVDGNTMVELEGGKTVTISEMVNSLKEKKNAKQMVNVDGEEMELEDLVNAYCKMNSEKKNSEEAEANKKKAEMENKNAEDEKKKKEDEEKANAEKKNAEEAEKKKKADEEDEEKKNAKYFEELQNANLTVHREVKMVETSHNQLQRGQQRYGKQTKKD